MVADVWRLQACQFVHLPTLVLEWCGVDGGHVEAMTEAARYGERIEEHNIQYISKQIVASTILWYENLSCADYLHY
jgi:hypothetical protein